MSEESRDEIRNTSVDHLVDTTSLEIRDDILSRPDSQEVIEQLQERNGIFLVPDHPEAIQIFKDVMDQFRDFGLKFCKRDSD